jgi:hypothetical protein
MKTILPPEIRQVAKKYLAEQEAGRNLTFVIIDKFTREIPHGWIIFSNNTTYLKTKDPWHFGGFGFIVEKGTHRIIDLSGADSEGDIEEFERSHNQK